MTQSNDFKNLKSVFRHTGNTTAVVDLLIPSTILRAKYNIHNPIVRKTYKEQGGIGYFSNYRNMFQNEVKYLKIVNGLPHFPKLIFVDAESCSIYMEYSGNTIFNDIIPVDWKKQLNVIISTLKKLGINHNDFYVHNLMVYNGILTLIDFGWADTKSNYPFYNLTPEIIEQSDKIGEIFQYLMLIRNRDFYDKNLGYLISNFKEELELSNYSGHRPSEIHTIIIWDTLDKDKALEYLNGNLPGTMEIISSEEITVDKSLENQIAIELYNNPADNRVRNGKVYLIVLRDNNPIYQLSKATACTQVLNTNMQKIKNELRTTLGGSSGAYFKAHSSYNLEESRLVLDLFEKSQLLQPRKNYDSLTEFFSCLNSHATLKYVVQRSHNDLESLNNYRDGSDIDILVNDYYLFKSITGAETNNKIYMRENDNGFYIQNNVLIAGIKVAVDIRYIGDDYNNSKWQFDMLNSRVLTEISSNLNVYISKPEDEFHSLVFNLLVQKHNRNNSKHYPRLTELAKSLELFNNPDETIEQYLNDQNRGWTELVKFFKRNNYLNINKPLDINVEFYTEPFSKINI
jgi:predicted Ser/Thr protein kinase